MIDDATAATRDRLRTPCVFRWLAAVLLDWAVILAALMMAARLHHPAGYVAAVLVVGNRQHALAIIGHDGAHRAASRTRWLNDTLTCLLCFWPLGLGLDGYRRHHYAHHRHTGTREDPELEYKGWGAPHWDLPTPGLRLFFLFVRDLFGLSPRELLNLRRTIPPVSQRDVVGPLLWWTAALGLLFVTGALWIALLWAISLGTAYWATFRLRVWTEHMGTPGTHRIHAAWWQRLLFLPHNTWCHWEHHRWPTYPSCTLQTVRELETKTPVEPLAGLFRSYRKSPSIPSGQPLREEERRR